MRLTPKNTVVLAIRCLETRWILATAYRRVSRKEDTVKLLEEVVLLLEEREEPMSPQRQDFHRSLEKCPKDLDEPLGTASEAHQNWRKIRA